MNYELKNYIINIRHLCGIHPKEKLFLQGEEMKDLGVLDEAWLSVDGDRISGFGRMADLDIGEAYAHDVIDAHWGTVLPCWCDPHTHLVYAGSREGEFVDKIQGLSYAEIARRGGGILNSADLLHEMSEDDLYRAAMQRLREMVTAGTGCVEIKSGYGLTTEDELKILRVIRRMKNTSSVRIMSTFLGAHAVGRAYAGRQGAYVDLVINEMIPAVAEEHLADFIDVFCDEGFFTPEETDRILAAGAKYGLRPKIHACELASSGGVEVGVRHHALSVDHLESASDADLVLLRGSATMPTLLPGTSFFLNMPYALGRQMIDSGLGIALASDCNPGSTPSSDMKFVVSLACIKMRLLPAEAINAATLNAAYAMGLAHDYGSIAVGKKANLQITDPIPSPDYIPYAYTRPIVRQVILEGKLFTFY